MKKLHKLFIFLIVILMAVSILPLTSRAVGEAIAIAVEVNSFGSSNTGGSSGNTLLRTDGTATTTGGTLRLTQNTNSQAGTTVRRNQIKLTNGFSTYFQFKISGSSNPPADGLAFIVYKSDTVKTGAMGEGLGYQGISDSIAVEFDTYTNSNQGDPYTAHAGIMLNGSPSHSGQTAYTYSTISSGSIIHVWVDYDGSTVTATYGTSATRSSNTTISRNVGSALVGQNVYMGFSASTGGSYSYHDVLKWYFKDAYVSGGLSSGTNAYTQAAATLGITLNSSSSDPGSATIKVYDSAGSAIDSNVDIYIDNNYITTGSASASGYTYNISGLATGSHTIRAVATGGASNFATFTVTAYPPTITTSPGSKSVNVGETASFNVSAISPDGGSLTYQWQLYSGGSWGNIEGATASSYTTGELAITDNAKRFRCVVTNTNSTKVASANSGEATLTVNRLTGTVSITGDPSKTYDGTAVSNPEASKNGSGAVTYTYYSDNSGGIGSQLAGAPVNGGTYWVRATVAQCDTYTQATNTRQFTISRKSIADGTEADALITYSLASNTYTTSPLPVSVTAASGVTGLGGITVYYEGTGDTVYTRTTTPPTNVGTYTISVDIAQGGNYGSFTGLELGSYEITKANTSGVTDAAYSGTYDGSAHSITLSGVPEGADVTYRTTDSGAYSLLTKPEFTDAGTYTVYYKISKANYSDLTGSKQVVISPKTMTSAMFAAIDGTFTYNGSDQEPVPVVTDGDPSIITTADYTVSYADNVYPGTATVTVSAAADGNYSGSVSKAFTIGKKALADGMIEDITGLIFNGAEQTPVPTVTDGSPSIIAASDYTVSYADNIYPGTATLTITAAADGNYKGTASKTFDIGKKELSSVMIADILPLTYNGAAQTPLLTVTDGTPSIMTEDDFTVSYSDNTNAGTATATITAKADGHYQGSASKTFTINKKALHPDMIAQVAALTYNGTAQQPSLTVTDGTPSIVKASDYTVSYANNTNAGTATATITAAAKGNYSGTASTTFTINKKTLDAAMMADLAPLTYNGTAQTPVPTVSDGTPSIITAADYTVSYSDNVKAGTATATLTATAGGNYTGTVGKTFVIGKKTLSPAMIAAIAAQTYSGSAITPRLTLTDGTPNVITTADYTVSYSSNTNAGTATATVTAAEAGNYTGRISRTFIINTAPISGTVSVPVSISAGDTAAANVSAILPADARLSYQWKRNGTAIGGATQSTYTAAAADAGQNLTVTVTGSGNYSGSVTSAVISVAPARTAADVPITLSAPIFEDGKVVIGGAVTLPEGEYTASLSFKTETGTTWEVLESGTYTSGKGFSADLSGLNADTVYIYRVTVIVDGQTYTMTGRFRTPKSNDTAVTGSITGSVQDNTGLGTDITVTIEAGNTVIASKAGLKNGEAFSFTKLPDGIYNVVANNGTYRVTQIITIKNGEAVGGVKMTIEKKQSIVEVKTEDTPEIAVGGLNELFKYPSMFTKADAKILSTGGTVEIKLVAERQQETTIDNADKDKIEGVASGDKIAMFLDLSVIKTVFESSDSTGEQTRLTELADLIEVVIPLADDLKGKSNITVYRMHEGTAEVIPSGIENANADGEYCDISSDYITLHVKKFSTYAIGYSDGTQTNGCEIHLWLLAVLIVLIVVAVLITRLNSRRLRDARRGDTL